MIKNELKFINVVMNYLDMEYDSKYLVLDKKAKNLISGYYWGGNSVPETARAVVEYIDVMRQNL